VEASRKHGCFDGRWDAFSKRSVPEPGRARLSLVPVEPVSDTADPQSEEAGTARLMAAMAAARSSEGRASREPWLWAIR
jgi:hypothetical protein